MIGVPLLTVTDKFVLSVSCPFAPLTVTVNVPPAALLEVVSVRVDAAIEDAGLRAAVTPLGNPLAEKVTLPANPFEGTTFIVEWPVVPAAMFKIAGDAVNVKLGAAVMATARAAV